MKLFVDTGAFIALVDADDQNHKAAAAFYREITGTDTRFVTTNFVVCETMNFLRARISYDIVLRFWENLKKSRFIDIVTVTPSIGDTAFRIFRQYADKEFSFTDGTSFLTMRSLRLKKAFTFDKHFGQFEGIGRLS